MKLNRPKPISDQVSNILKERIKAGKYSPGAKFPSEKMLVEEFGVSRTTIRLATSSLADEGIIIRKPGDASYVSKEALEFCSQLEGGFNSFFNLIEKVGYKATIKLSSLNRRKLTKEEVELFGLSEDADLLVIYQTHFADDLPAITSEYMIPFRYLSEKAEEYKANTPITELLQKCLLRKIFYNKTEISASMSNDAILKIFDFKISSPILMLKDYFYDEENSPILFSVSFLNEKIINLSYIHNWKQ